MGVSVFYIGELETDATNKQGERSAEQEDLDAVLAYLEKIKPHCGAYRYG